MFITAKSVYLDTKNFFRNYFVSFLLIALFCAFITMIFSHAFLPSKEHIVSITAEDRLLSNANFFELVRKMTPEQKHILFCISAVSTFSGLIGNALLVGGVLLLIQLVISRHHVSVLHAISASTPVLPKLFILVFLITVLVQIGIIFLVFPGVLLAIIFSFAPIIVVQDKIVILKAIYKSVKLACENIRLVAPAITSWLLAKTLLLLLEPYFTLLMSNIGIICINTLSNLISTVLLIYLFRLYMLIHQ